MSMNIVDVEDDIINLTKNERDEKDEEKLGFGISFGYEFIIRILFESGCSRNATFV